MLLPLLLLRAALRMEPKDCNGPIVLKNSAEARFWPAVCMSSVIDGGAHHDGSDSITGPALLRVQPR